MAPGAPNLTRAIAWATKSQGPFVFEEDPPMTDEQFERAERQREARRARSIRGRLGSLLRRQ